MDGQGFIVYCRRDESGYDFFQVLMGSILVERAEDDRGNAVGEKVGQDQAIRPALGRRIRAAGLEGVLFVHRFPEGRPVNFGGGDVYEALDGIHELQHRVGDRVCSKDVGFKEFTTLQDGSCDVCFSGKMYDNITFLHQGIDHFNGGDAAQIELEALAVLEDSPWNVPEPSSIGECVKNDDHILRMIIIPVAHKIAANKAGTTGYQNGFQTPSFL